MMETVKFVSEKMW